MVPAGCLAGVTYTCNKTASVAIMTIAVSGMAGAYVGFLPNHIDIAPNYSGNVKPRPENKGI